MTSSTLVATEMPSTGNTARIGITEMSWNSSTANADWPPAVRSRPRSSRLDSTIAVDDIANVSPIAIAGRHDVPITIAAIATTAAVSDDLQAAEPDDRPAQLPQQRGPQLEADDEQHHDDAELGEVHDAVPLAADEAEQPGSDHDAGDEVAEDSAQAEALGDRREDHRGQEVDEGLREDAIAHAISRRSSEGRAVARLSAAAARSSASRSSRRASISAR